MPIRPKHTMTGARPLAARQFTDREDFIAAFQNARRRPVTDQPKVLVYYGVGGIGKSSLRRQLLRMLADEPNLVSAFLDFDVQSSQDQDTALFALRRRLQSEFKIHFPTFDVAYALYWQKTRPQTPFTKEHFGLLEDSVHLADIVHLAGELPLVGILSRLGLFAVKGSVLLRDWWQRRGHKELDGLATLEPREIENRLPMFWAADLRDGLEQKQSRAVIFLDTYEALTEGERSEGRLRRHDDWVRELVAHLPEALWVICGRERLRWEEVDPDWAACLEQHLLGGLADSDARQFLAACGIEDQAIQQAITEGSKGVPYYLDLAVDTWQEVRERAGQTPQAGDFARTPLEVLDRFLRHLTQPEVETLKVLSAPRHWDYELFRMLVSEFQTGFPVTAFSELCRFSFISEDAPAAPEVPEGDRAAAGAPDAASGVFRMHDLMRQSLQEHQAPELNRRVHRFLFEYYDRQLQAPQDVAISARHRAALAEAFYHGNAVLGPHDLVEWLVKAGQNYYLPADCRFVLPMAQQAVQIVESALGPEHPDLARALSFLGLMIGRQHRYQESLPYFERALAIAEKAFGPEHVEVARRLRSLGSVFLALVRYTAAEPLLIRALAFQEKLLGPEHEDTVETSRVLLRLYFRQQRHAETERLGERLRALAERQHGLDSDEAGFENTALAELRVLQGRYREAETMFRHELERCEKLANAGNPFAIPALSSSLGEACLRLGKYVEAEELFRRALALWERIYGPELVPGMTARTALLAAELLTLQDRFVEAEPLAQRGFDACGRFRWADHAFVVPPFPQSTLAGFYSGQGRYAEAEPLLTRSLAIQEPALGPEHPAVAQTLSDLFQLHWRMGDVTRAEESCRRGLAIRQKALQPGSVFEAESLNQLGMVQSAHGDYAEAESYYQRALAIREQALGSEHIDVAEVIGNLGELRRCQGRFAEAESLARQALAIWEQALGPGHSRVGLGRARLAVICTAAGRRGEAREFARQAQTILDQALGRDHPETRQVRARLEGLGAGT